MKMILKILSIIISSFNSKTQLSLLWSMYLLRKPPSASQSTTFTISRSSLLAGFVPTWPAEEMSVQTTADNTLTYGCLVPTLMVLLSSTC